MLLDPSRFFSQNLNSIIIKLTGVVVVISLYHFMPMKSDFPSNTKRSFSALGVVRRKTKLSLEDNNRSWKALYLNLPHANAKLVVHSNKHYVST